MSAHEGLGIIIMVATLSIFLIGLLIGHSITQKAHPTHHITLTVALVVAFFALALLAAPSRMSGATIETSNPLTGVVDRVRTVNPDEFMCMAKTIYFESRGEPLYGQIVVSKVVMDRVSESRYPDRICEVVTADQQFSWYWDGKSDKPKNAVAIIGSAFVAALGMSGMSSLIVPTAAPLTHYHADYVSPDWSSDMQLVLQVGRHLFYSEKPRLTGASS